MRSSIRSQPGRWRFAHSRRWAGICALALASSCVGCATNVPQRTVDSGLFFALDSGLAIAPVVQVNTVALENPRADFLSNELYTYMLVQVDAPIVGPHDLTEQIGLQGFQAEADFRDFQQRRLEKTLLDPAECTRLSRMLLHRYVLITWMDENADGGFDSMTGDITQRNAAENVLRDSFYMVRGTLQGEVLDLWEAKVLWTGRASYVSGRLYGQTDVARGELERARAEGIVEYVNLLTR